MLTIALTSSHPPAATAVDTELMMSNPDIEFVRAAELGDCEVLRQRLKAGADPDGGLGAGEWTPLMRAASVGLLDVVDLLLRAGADPDKRWEDGDQETALMEAAEGGHAHVVKRLLEGGATPDLRDANGETALSRAAAFGHVAIVDHLLRAGADPEIEDTEGNSALVRAAVWDRYDVVSRLLEARPSGPSDELRQLMLNKARAGETESVVALVRAGVPVDPEFLDELAVHGFNQLAEQLSHERKQ